MKGQGVGAFWIASHIMNAAAVGHGPFCHGRLGGGVTLFMPGTCGPVARQSCLRVAHQQHSATEQPEGVLLLKLRRKRPVACFAEGTIDRSPDCSHQWQSRSRAPAAVLRRQQGSGECSGMDAWAHIPC